MNIRRRFINGVLVEHTIDGVPQPLSNSIPVGQVGVQRSATPALARAVPLAEWPLWAKALKLLAKPEDKGIGDVVARTIGDEKSQAFKTWYKTTFKKDCGCAGRRAKWNALYPIQSAGSPPAQPLQKP